MPTKPDIELLSAWRAGDIAAGNTLYSRHFQSIYRFFANKADGESLPDLVQDTFAAVSSSRHRFSGKSSFRTFIFSIARNILFNHYRKKDRSLTHEQLSSCSVADFKISPTAELRRKQEQRVLLTLLRTLPLEMQIVLELHYWENLTGNQISEIVGVPVGTVYSRMQRGRDRLRDELKRIGMEEAATLPAGKDFDVWAANITRILSNTESPRT